MLKEDEINKLEVYFGENITSNILCLLEAYIKKWHLKNLILLNYISFNALFFCQRNNMEFILKVCPKKEESRNEFLALKTYNFRPFVKIIDFDIKDGILLLEKIKPGNSLREVRNLEKRLEIFINLYQEIKYLADNKNNHPVYLELLDNMLYYLRDKKVHEKIYFKLERAKNFYLELIKEFDKNLLLHGDLHHDNILLDNNGNYVIIDPKSICGDPIFDIARFIHNEFDYDLKPLRIKKIISILAKGLNITKSIICKVLYIDIILGNCWNIESGLKIEETKISLAESLLD